MGASCNGRNLCGWWCIRKPYEPLGLSCLLHIQRVPMENGSHIRSYADARRFHCRSFGMVRHFSIRCPHRGAVTFDTDNVLRPGPFIAMQFCMWIHSSHRPSPGKLSIPFLRTTFPSLRHSSTTSSLQRSILASPLPLETTVTHRRDPVTFRSLASVRCPADPSLGMSALIYGLMSFLLCICFGYNGLGVSPARDLGPRFIAWWVGYGTETFSSGWWAYGPIAAGLTGVLTGAFVYDAFIFVGNESPLNYNWPNPEQLVDKVKAKKKQVQEKTGKLDV